MLALPADAVILVLLRETDVMPLPRAVSWVRRKTTCSPGRISFLLLLLLAQTAGKDLVPTLKAFIDGLVPQYCPDRLTAKVTITSWELGGSPETGIAWLFAFLSLPFGQLVFTMVLFQLLEPYTVAL